MVIGYPRPGPVLTSTKVLLTTLHSGSTGLVVQPERLMVRQDIRATRTKKNDLLGLFRVTALSLDILNLNAVIFLRAGIQISE